MFFDQKKQMNLKMSAVAIYHRLIFSKERKKTAHTKKKTHTTNNSVNFRQNIDNRKTSMKQISKKSEWALTFVYCLHCIFCISSSHLGSIFIFSFAKHLKEMLLNNKFASAIVQMKYKKKYNIKPTTTRHTYMNVWSTNVT